VIIVTVFADYLVSPVQLADTPTDSPLELQLPARAPSVTEARHAVAAYADRLGADEGAVALAVSEAVGNAVVHAYPEGNPGTITVRALTESGFLVVSVADDGTGMRPNPQSTGLGLGLPLIGRLSAGLEIESTDGGGAVVRMRFELPGRADG
jgi:serine/threonine-protein kinase RsbW/stage II sporulation protein AB (anti-sigma F factor)